MALDKPNHLASIALIAVCAGYFIAPLGMTAVNVAIPSLANDLQADAEKIGWLPTVYLLSNVAFMLPVGKLADNFGRKKMYVYGLILNLVAASMCAVASNIDFMLFWRFIQGLAGAMIFGTGIAIVSSIVPEHKRGSALGLVAACVYVGLTRAPAFGGYLTELLGWRAVFYFQVPLVLLLLVFIFAFFKGEWKHPERVKYDYKGTLLFTVFTFSLVYGLSKLPSLLGIALSCFALITLGVFVLHQSKSRQPLIRVQMFRESKVFSLSLTTSFFMYGSNFAIVFLLSLYLQFIKGYSPAFTGKILLLQALAMAVMAPFAGKLSDKFEPRVISTIGCIIVAFGFILLNLIDINTSAEHVGVALLMTGLGFGLFSTPNNNAIMGSVSENEVGIASASMNLSRTVGNLVGMSLVNLMLHYFIGETSLDDSQTEQLMLTISLALKMSLSFVLFACLFSSLRGRQNA